MTGYPPPESGPKVGSASYQYLRKRERMKTIPGVAADMVKTTKWNAKRRGVHHCLTSRDIINLLETQNYACAVTGIPFKLDVISRRKNPFSPSIDRKTPGGAYSPENVQIVCMIYNYAKNAYNHEHVAEMADALVRRHGHSG